MTQELPPASTTLMYLIKSCTASMLQIITYTVDEKEIEHKAEQIVMIQAF